MPRSVKQKKYASRWANEAASLAKTLQLSGYHYCTDVSPLPTVDELTETQATQDNGRKNASNLTVIDTKDKKKKTRPVQRTSNVVSDDSSGDEWKPYSRRRKRPKKKHPSGRRTSTSGSTTSSSLQSERNDQDQSTVEQTKPSPHQITFTFSPCTPSTDNKGSDKRNTSEENATGVKLKETASDDAKKSEFGITSSKRPYAVWSEFCAKLDRELEENRRHQDKLKAKLKYDAEKTYKMFVAKKENARKKENAQRREKDKTKFDIKTSLPSTQSIPDNKVKTTSILLDGSRRSAGVKQVTSHGRLHVQAPKRTAMTSAKHHALLSAALSKESTTCSAKHPPVSVHVPTQPWTSKHRRRLVLQWLKTLQNPTDRTGKKTSVNSLPVPPGLSQLYLTLHLLNTNQTTVLSPLPDKATNKAPGDKLEGGKVDSSSHQNLAQDPCETTKKGTADDVLSKGTRNKATKLQHSVWSSDSESDSSADSKISKTTLEVTTQQYSTTEDKGKDEKSPEVSTCPPFTHASSVNTPVENPSSSSIDTCDKDSDNVSTPKNN
ncbi:Flotillin-like protein 1 [Branchiostoma belcheri]|nr:Flotillin-like protein 1 [Branchiostoma belcheri]